MSSLDFSTKFCSCAETFSGRYTIRVSSAFCGQCGFLPLNSRRTAAESAEEPTVLEASEVVVRMIYRRQLV